MSQEDCSHHLHAYREAVKRHGPGFEATLWRSREGQQIRFDVMIELAGGFEGCRIVDAGCGAGDFAGRLIERGVRFERYVGIDALPEMIQCARARGLERCEFIVADLLADASAIQAARPDFTCMSGTLNTMADEPARKLVRAAFEASAQGVVFNFLSNCAPECRLKESLSPARRFDTLDWIEWALNVSCKMSFTLDYLDGHDATILIRR